MKYLVKLGVIMLALLAMVSCARDEEETMGSIYGIVSDVDSNQAIQGVTVHLLPAGNSVVTGSDGSYEFVDLLPGQYKLQIQSSDYQDNTKNITVVAGQRASGDMQLSRGTSKLKLSTRSLNFGSHNTTLTFDISNVSSSGDVAWHVTTEDDWFTVTPADGSTAMGKSSVVTVTVLREKVDKNKSGVLTVSYDGGSVAVLVSASVGQSTDNRYVESSPASVDFGAKENATLTLKATNGAIDFKLMTEGDASWFSASETSGTLPAYSANDASTEKQITLYANRSGLSKGTYSFTLLVRSTDSKLDDFRIPVTMTVAQDTPKGSCGSIQSCDDRILVNFIGCTKLGSTVEVEFSLQNMGDDLSTFSLDHFTAYDNEGGSYGDGTSNSTKMKLTVGGKSVSIYGSSPFAMPSEVLLKGKMQLLDMPSSVTSLSNLTMKVSYVQPWKVTLDKIVFKNLRW